MQLELTSDEAAILRNILDHYLGELRMEIAGTERLAWREQMHIEEDVIKSLLTRLPAETTTTQSPPQA